MIICLLELRLCLFFFFKQKTAYEMRISDWSSDVCSSDLVRFEHDGFPAKQVGKEKVLRRIVANIAEALAKHRRLQLQPAFRVAFGPAAFLGNGDRKSVV